MLTRRRVLALGGLGLAAAASPALWLAPRRARAAERRAPLLVVIFLRGGADALHLVPPIGDPGYAPLRGSLAIARPLPFADGFGLHPALAPLQPLVERGELAAVHAVGSSDRSRSHFEAQDRMELADDGRGRAGTGWLARALGPAAAGAPFAHLALAGALPLSLHGSGAFAIGDPAGFALDGLDAAGRAALVRRYAEAGDDPLATAGRAALAALAAFERHAGALRAAPAGVGGGLRGRRRPDPPLPERVRQLLALERSGLAITAAALESHGWDTHRRQGTDEGAMARPIRELAEGLAALADGLRARRDWLVVAMTEFGRTARPNGSGGTDHGHGSAMLLAGPRVRPGVHGRWPGLAESALHEGRDLAVTTDFRHVLHEALVSHLGGAPAPDTFPGFTPQPLGAVG